MTRTVTRRIAVSGRRDSGAAVARYIASLPAERSLRFLAIQAAIRQAGTDIVANMRHRKPTFEKDGRWVALANRKHHLAVHMCAPDLLAGIRARHPELDCGAACVRIRDTQYVPIYELRAAFVAAFGESATAPAGQA